MKIKAQYFILPTLLFLAACDSEKSEPPKQAINFTPTDGNASYKGSRSPAPLSVDNSLTYTKILFTDSSFSTPNLVLNKDIQTKEPNKDFLKSQEQLIKELKPIFSSGIQAKAPPTSNVEHHEATVVCQNNGTIVAAGDLNHTTQKGQLQLTYNQCQVGNFLLSGKAYFLIYNASSDFNQINSATLSYNATNAQHIISKENEVFNGTVSELIDTNTGSTRYSTNLHRHNQNTNTDILITGNRSFFSYDQSIQFSGELYHSYFGKASLSTKQSLMYNNNIPTSGVLELSSENKGIAQISILPSYDNKIALSVMVDSDGDGIFEGQANTQY